MARAEFARRVAHAQTDPDLTTDLRTLAPEATDDLPLP